MCKIEIVSWSVWRSARPANGLPSDRQDCRGCGWQTHAFACMQSQGLWIQSKCRQITPCKYICSSRRIRTWKMSTSGTLCEFLFFQWRRRQWISPIWYFYKICLSTQTRRTKHKHRTRGDRAKSRDPDTPLPSSCSPQYSCDQEGSWCNPHDHEGLSWRSKLQATRHESLFGAWENHFHLLWRAARFGTSCLASWANHHPQQLAASVST